MKRATLFLALTTVLLGGCASTAMKQNAAFVDDFAKQKVGASATLRSNAADSAASRAMAETLLAQPLSQDDAVRVALAVSPQFQAMLADGAVMSAAATQAGRVSNPLFTFERLVRRDHGEIDLDLGRILSVSLIDIITLPSRLKVADSMQSEARLRAAAGVVETAANARQAWVLAVAAQQSLTYFERVMEAAEASAELARRMYQGGNFSKLQRARQQAFYADAIAQLARAKQTTVATRESLIRTLGLDNALAAKLILPARLPDLPTRGKTEAMVAQAALEQRLDVQMARAELSTLAAKSGLGVASSYVNAFHVAGINNSETGKPPQRGYELELALPIFDWGDAKRAGAKAQYLAAMQRAAQTAINADSSTREHYAAWRATYDIAKHYRLEVMPVRKVIADEVLLKYNGMLSGVFDLLAETRAQIGSVMLTIDAERDFWLADAALQATLLGKPVAGVAMGAVAEVGGGGGAGH